MTDSPDNLPVPPLDGVLILAPRMSGKSAMARWLLMSWWDAWEGGYRGPMPFVVGPGWKPPHSAIAVTIDG